MTDPLLQRLAISDGTFVLATRDFLEAGKLEG